MLFADAAEAWTGLRDQVDQLAVIASRRRPGTEAPASGRRWGSSGTRAHLAAEGDRAARASERARILADDARVRVFDLLGERRRALAILERRLTSAQT